jgi:D-alanyl-D-alanine carboxypeptidase/D-alanyl-D-alanine-endopeptidase (penicillin-binding protein 4)
MQHREQQNRSDPSSLIMKLHFPNVTPKRVSHIKSMTKPIGMLILLLNAHLGIQQTAEAKNAVPSRAASLIVAQQSSQTNTKPVPLCPAQLSAAIEAIANRREFSKGRWGILIQTRANADTLYNRDAEKYFVPASNVKLLTTAAALQQLGAPFRIRTSVYGTSDGGLRIIGRGDPSLTDSQLRELAQQLSQRGVRQVSQLRLEDNYFRGPAVNPNWEWEDVQADFGAPVNSLILNQNAVKLTLFPQQLSQPLRFNWSDPVEAMQWRINNESITASSGASATINVSQESKRTVLKITGQLGIDSAPEPVSLAVIDPQEHFLRHFRSALANAGINEIATVRAVRIEKLQSVLSNQQAASLVNELAFVESPPLSELLKETNQNSNNLYAEALLRVLGAKVGKLTAPTDSTAQIGLGVVKATLTQLGVDPASYVMVDGSGLSRHNLVSPAAIAQTLRAMANSPLASVYRASLSVAGTSGTLQNRFRGTAAQGIVQAKTGTIGGVVALSGYIDVPNYEPLVFSIIVNQSDRSAATLRQAIDEIVILLTRLRRC